MILLSSRFDIAFQLQLSDVFEANDICPVVMIMSSSVLLQLDKFVIPLIQGSILKKSEVTVPQRKL